MSVSTVNSPGLREWLFRSRAITEATTRAPTSEQRFCLGQSAEALNIADHQLELARVEDARGSTNAAISLYRESLYWSLRALDPESAVAEVPTLEALFRTLPRRMLADLAGGSVALLALDDALVRDSFVATARLAPDARLRVAEAAKQFAHAAFDAAERQGNRLERLRRQRVTRPLALLLLAMSLVGVAAFFVHRGTAPPLISNRRPYMVSSQIPPYSTTRRLTPRLHDGWIFHTTEEREPWFRVDLGRVRTITSIEIENRHEACCKARAIPLVVEVSNDGRRYRPVATRYEVFDTWTPEFSGVTGRFVRLRVQGRSTILHLAGVEIFGR